MTSDIVQWMLILALVGIVTVLCFEIRDRIKDIRSLKSDIMVLQSKEFARDDRINNLSKMVYDNAYDINYLNTEVFGDEES